MACFVLTTVISDRIACEEVSNPSLRPDAKVETCISDSQLDLLDLLNGLLLVQAVDEEVHVRGGAELLVVVLPELSPGSRDC